MLISFGEYLRRPRVVVAATVMTFAVACAVGSPTAIREQSVAPEVRQLEVIAEPKAAADFLLNPKPVGSNNYVRGLTVTIDVIPKAEWELYEWIGPVYGSTSKTARIDMNASQSVVARFRRISNPSGASANLDANALSNVLPVAPTAPAPTSVTSIATPQVNATLVPIPTPTQTLIPTRVPTHTATPRPTATQRPTATPRPTPTSTVRPTATSRPSPTPKPVTSFGPYSGGLFHDPNQNTVKTFSAGVAVSDFVVEADFVNPHTTTAIPWDFGFMVRGPGRMFDMIAVTSAGRWEHQFYNGGNYDNIGSGYLATNSTRLNTSIGSSNNLRLIVIGDTGWIFVNGQYLESLALGSSGFSGDVEVATGFFTGNEAAGAVTRYEDFTVNPLPQAYGPTDGNLVLQPGFISTHSSGLSLINLIVEARFNNPSPQSESWSYGFEIRNRGPNTFDAIFVRHRGQHQTASWEHYTRSGSIDSNRKLASGVVSLNAGLRDSNKLRLIVSEDRGWLFVNDQFVTELNLGAYTEPGDVQAFSGFFTDDEILGVVIRFQDFTIWTLPSTSASAATPTPIPTRKANPTPTRVSQIPPHLSAVTATINGEIVPDATEITAYIDGRQVASSRVAGGVAILVIPGDASYAGKIISFRIGSRDAVETDYWEQGGHVNPEIRISALR